MINVKWNQLVSTKMWEVPSGQPIFPAYGKMPTMLANQAETHILERIGFLVKLGWKVR